MTAPRMILTNFEIFNNGHAINKETAVVNNTNQVQINRILPVKVITKTKLYTIARNNMQLALNIYSVLSIFKL